MNPVFRDTDKNDPKVTEAHAQCANTIGDFVNFVKEERLVTYMAKLRFIDPDLSEKNGHEHVFYLWLNEVLFHENDNMLSGVFFEVPEGFEKWHAVGSRLGFDPEDVFDWMINDEGHVQGGFTIRATREKLETEFERKKYDEYIGIKSYEPIT